VTRTCAGLLVAVAVAAGLALRLAHLDVRPMHHDEANQAVKFGALLERGDYRYDAYDHHGPTLYYLSLPAAALRGQATLASLDERTLRGVTVAFGVATLLLLPLLWAGIGRTAVAAGAVLMALSPAMTFYSRMYIQEALFACFALAFVIAAGRVAVGGGRAWAMLAGVAAGLTLATKETSIIVLPAALASCVLARFSLHGTGLALRTPSGGWGTAVAAAAASAAVVAALFYSSFLAAPAAVVEPFLAIGTYLDRGIEPAGHGQPWYYYLGLLTYFSSGGLRWSEGVVLVLAAVGASVAWRADDPSRPERAFWARHLAGYTLVTAAVYSAIRYKTPWNLLPFYAGALVLAGIGFSRLVHARSSRAFRGALVGALIVASAHLGWQAWRASVVYPADPRNPYVHAQTVPDAVRMATRIRALAALHPDGDRMLVAVVAPPYEQWPLPWYLRAMPHVGYWTAPSDALAFDAPVLVTSLEHTAAVDAALGERYVSEFYGLRPDVLLALHVEHGLWDRFLGQAASGASTPAGVR
jgi:uncharacterized protein (TIGR03663 family)